MRRIRHRSRSDRGTALLETAVTAPLFFLLIFGLLEFGLAFRQYLTLSNATRTTARAVSAAGNTAEADFIGLQEIKRSTAAIRSNEIEFMIVYHAPSVTASPESTPSLAACLTGSVTGVCNRYLPSDMNRPITDFGCAATSPDRFWCPDTRNVALSGPPDYVGVYIKTHYTALTGAFGKSYDFTDNIVYRLEPQER